MMLNFEYPFDYSNSLWPERALDLRQYVEMMYRDMDSMKHQCGIAEPADIS